MSHPRCTNCHTEGAEPLQRNNRPHVPPVQRGSDGRGVGNSACVSCHGDRNTASAPGAPNWRMPAADQAAVFRGRSAAAICQQIRDVARNGGLDAEGLGRHLAEDPLVAWAWRAGPGRAPPPITREDFVAATIAWLKDGAPCPAD